MTKDINDYNNALNIANLGSGKGAGVFEAGAGLLSSLLSNKQAKKELEAQQLLAAQEQAETEAKAKQQKNLIIAGVSGVAIIGFTIIMITILKRNKNAK